MVFVSFPIFFLPENGSIACVEMHKSFLDIEYRWKRYKKLFVLVYCYYNTINSIKLILASGSSQTQIRKKKACVVS